MSCQNCHNTHSSTARYPLVDPHNPGSTGAWKSDETGFCLTCHDGSALPTSHETTPWAGPVLASGGATTVVDIKSAYQVNVHGFGSPSDPTTTTAYLRQDMGYKHGDVLACSACHDPHGSLNDYALQQNVVSASGDTTVTGVVVAPVPGGGDDLRFFCGACHLFDPATHDSMAGTSTVAFPTDCTACHRHVRNGVPSANL